MSALILIAILPVTALAIWPPAHNAFEPIKLAVILSAGAALAARSIHQVILHGRLTLPPLWMVTAGGGFGVALLLATVTSADPLLSAVGVRGRYGGLLTYAALGAIVLAGTVLADQQLVRRLLQAVCATAGVVSLLGLAQWAGADLLPGRGSAIGVSATLGNANFAAAWVGIALPAVIWCACSDTHRPWQRAASAVVGVAAVLCILATGTLQGIPTAAAAVTPLLLLAAGRLRQRAARTLQACWLLLIAAGGMLIAAGVTGAGPARALAQQTGVVLRGHYWQAALAMAGEHPLTGIGLDGYSGAYRLFRTPAAAQAVDLTSAADAAHSVPLHLLAGGGLPLLVTYVAFVAVTGVRILWGIRHMTGSDRWLLAGVAGMWLGYHVQSLVSVDVPALVAVHAVTAGVGVGFAGGAARQWRMPWAGDGVETPRRQGRRPAPAARRTAVGATTRTVAGNVAAAVLTIVALVVALQPLRAEQALRRSAMAARAGEEAVQLAAAARAADIGIWDPVYAHHAGLAHQRTGDRDQALAYYRQVDQREPGRFDSAYSAALLLRDQDVDAASRWYRRTLQLEPHHPDVLQDAAAFYLDADQPEAARPLIDRLIEQDPHDPDVQLLRSALDG